MLRIFKVSGNSMLPTLKNSDYILASTVVGRLSIGTIIVCKHPEFGIITKRVHQLLDNNYFLLEGDNKQESSSTEAIGPIHKKQVLGKHLITIKASIKNPTHK